MKSGSVTGSENASGFQAENGTDALSACKDAVAHGGVDRGRWRALGRKKLFESGIDDQTILFKKIGKLHRCREA
jgi:hypothetical protein